MRVPKIIFFNINIKKEIKKSNKKEAKKALTKMNKDLVNLINSNDDDFDKILAYIENGIASMSNKDMDKLYKEYELGVNELKPHKNLAINSNEVPIYLYQEKSLGKNSEKYKKITEKLLNINNKIENFLNKKSTKFAIGFSVVLFFSALSILLYKQNTLAIEVVAPLSTIPDKINKAYEYVKILGFVVAFIFLCIELVQKGLKGDTRAMAMIFAKYLLFSIFLLSFKAIYDMLDKFFNS